jgi:uncharacterized protein (DUF983 family)
LRRVAAAADRGFEIFVCSDQNQCMYEIRSWKKSMARGFMCRCPSCGKGRLFRAFLKVADTCPNCGTDLHHQRADDAPPYFTMMIVGHILIPSVVIVERVWHPEIWLQLAVWLPLTVFLTIGLLQPVKGAIVGLQWALRMHGFAAEQQ